MLRQSTKWSQSLNGLANVGDAVMSASPLQTVQATTKV